MKVSHKVVFLFSALSWLAIGIMLLTKGFKLLLLPLEVGQSYLLIDRVSFLSGNKEQSGLVLACLGLMLGFIKGRMVLSKSAYRIMKRLESLGNPCSITSVYPLSYVIVILSMVALGISLRWMPVPPDLKGLIDIAIGSALTNGSAYYFRQMMVQKTPSL